MKKIALLFVLAGLFGSVHAQHEQTLFSRGKVRGAFIATNFTYGKIDGKEGYGAGGGLGLVVENFFVGGFGQAEIFDVRSTASPSRALGLGYGGLWLGYHFPTRSILHLYTSLKVGGGATGLGRWSRYNTWDFDLDFDEDDINDAVLVIAPEAGVELNITHWMRLAGTIGYRYVDGFQGYEGLDSKKLNATYYGLTLRIGWFGHRSRWRSHNDM